VKNNQRKSEAGLLADVRTLAEEKPQSFTAYFLFSAFYKQQSELRQLLSD